MNQFLKGKKVYNTDTQLYPFAADAPWTVLNQGEFWRISANTVLMRSKGEWEKLVNSRKNSHYDVPAHYHIQKWLEKNAHFLREMCLMRAAIIRTSTAAYAPSGVVAGEPTWSHENNWITQTPLYKAAVEESKSQKVRVTINWPNGDMESASIAADKLKELL